MACILLAALAAARPGNVRRRYAPPRAGLTESHTTLPSTAKTTSSRESATTFSSPAPPPTPTSSSSPRPTCRAAPAVSPAPRASTSPSGILSGKVPLDKSVPVLRLMAYPIRVKLLMYYLLAKQLIFQDTHFLLFSISWFSYKM